MNIEELIETFKPTGIIKNTANKISVIIPSYNQASYLPDAIESVLTQKVAPHEIIVVDDGSTDGSLEIARKYAVKVIVQVNKGLPSARNTGIMNATGDYILPLDAEIRRAS